MIKIGDRVVTIVDCWPTEGGKVTNIYEHDPEDPIVGHGQITVLLDTGQEEHYVHYGWEKILKVI